MLDRTYESQKQFTQFNNFILQLYITQFLNNYIRHMLIFIKSKQHTIFEVTLDQN